MRFFPVCAALALVSAPAVPPATPGLYGSKDWDDGKAELLVYDVIRIYRGDTLHETATWITETGFYAPTSGEFTRKRERDHVEVLQAVLRRPGAAEGLSVSALAALQWDRRRPQSRWWQRTSLHGIYGGHWRRLALEDGKLALRVESTGGEGARVLQDYKPPLLTEEMLFTHLRNIPQRRGFKEEVWLLDSQLGDRPSYHAQYAKIEVMQENVLVRELNACLVVVARDDGKRHEFWLHRQGLHPVIKARLADGSDWTLRTWERKKYWSF